MKTAPKLTIIDCLCNFDHSIEPGSEEKLRSGKYVGWYTGWNFCGRVWYENGKFYCQVRRYHSHIATLESKTLAGIMDVVSEKFGYE